MLIHVGVLYDGRCRKKDLIRNSLIALTSTVPYVGVRSRFFLINIFHQRQKYDKIELEVILNK